MNYLKIADDFEASVIVAGCMRIKAMDFSQADEFVRACIDNGINFFDHADIYGGGVCEEIFGSVLKADPLLREKMIVQSKCGIVSGKMFDFSYQHIIKSVDASLKRLNTEYLDSLLLHRPDVLVEPEEVAKAFSELKKSGKVKHFGVSNQHPLQIELLKTALNEPILFNQVQFSAAFTPMIDFGLNVNMQNNHGIFRGGGIIEHARMNNIVLQAWSPLQFGKFGGVFIGHEDFKELNVVLNELASAYLVSPEAIAVAFILRHPAKWQVVLGTSRVDRIKSLCKAATVRLTREEWYRIYKANGNILP